MLISIKKSVVVDDLDIGRTINRPHKAHPPLLVDANTVLTQAISSQRLQWLPGGDRKNSSVQAAANCDSFRSATDLMLEKRFDLPASKSVCVSPHLNDWIMRLSYTVYR
jgi:hypothetical protein